MAGDVVAVAGEAHRHSQQGCLSLERKHAGVLCPVASFISQLFDNNAGQGGGQHCEPGHSYLWVIEVQGQVNIGRGF